MGSVRSGHCEPEECDYGSVETLRFARSRTFSSLELGDFDPSEFLCNSGRGFPIETVRGQLHGRNGLRRESVLSVDPEVRSELSILVRSDIDNDEVPVHSPDD